MLSLQEALMIIDAYALVGSLTVREVPADFPELFDDMARTGVDRAAAVSLRALHADARKGNDYLLAQAAGDPRVIPVGVVSPHTGMLDVPALVADCVANGAAALAFPVQPGALASLSFRRTLRSAAGTGLPLIACSVIDRGVPSQLAELTSALDCRLLFAGTAYLLLDELIAVLEEHPHVYVDTSWQVSPGSIELLVKAGPGRVLFGSSAPVRPVLPALNMVLDADLDDTVKRDILAGNALRFFGMESEFDELTRPLPEVRVTSKPAIDVHNHLGTIPAMSATVRDVDAIERLAGAAGMEYSVCSSYVAYHEDLESGNREMLEKIEGRPRLLGSPVISPTHMEDSIRWLDMFDRNDRLAHATLMIDTVRDRPGSEGLMKLFAEAAKRGAPIFFNGPSWDSVRHLYWPKGPGNPPFEGRSASAELLDMLVEVDRRHPELALIMGHGMGDDGIWVAQRTKSVYVEQSGTYPERGFVRKAIDGAGKERVVFGSDLDLIKPAYALGVYAAAEMSAEEERLVMAENARRILRLPPP